MSDSATPTTPEQDAATSQADRIAIIAIAALAVVGMVVLMVLHIATAEFSGFILVLIVTVVGQLFTHQKVTKIDLQTNGNLTKRLDNQTADIVNAVSSLQEKPARKAKVNSTPVEPETVSVGAPDLAGE